MRADDEILRLSLPLRRDAQDWHAFVWNLPDQFLTRPQKLQLMLMLEAEFMRFDPFLVVGDLLTNRSLWHGVIMDRAFLVPDCGKNLGTCMVTDLIRLRDLCRGYWNADVVYVLTTSKVTEDRLGALVARWNADYFSFFEGWLVSSLLGSGEWEKDGRILAIHW